MSEKRSQQRSVEGGRGLEVAALAGGCFWGVEDILDVPGVIDTDVGTGLGPLAAAHHYDDRASLDLVQRRGLPSGLLT